MQPGGFDLGQLLASAQQMQAQVEQAQASLAGTRITGSAGGGLVRADVNGSGELVGLHLDPSVVDPADAETLADLVVAAVRDGVRAANQLTQKAMTSVAGGMLGGLGLPGMELPGLGAIPAGHHPDDVFGDDDFDDVLDDDDDDDDSGDGDDDDDHDDEDDDSGDDDEADGDDDDDDSGDDGRVVSAGR